MKTILGLPLLAIPTAIAFSSPAHAALYDRGNGMIYDSSQNITWLQDANYANTSGYTTTNFAGRMTWDQATAWADQLVYGGYDDWRLPSAGLSGTATCSTAANYATCPDKFNGAYDTSYNNSRSEIGHLFLELDNKANYTINGIEVAPSERGFLNTTFVDSNSQKNVSFNNVQWSIYWEAEKLFVPNNPNTGGRWNYSAVSGYQSGNLDKSNRLYAWAVRDGDVAPSNVPIPSAIWFMFSGLAGLVAVIKGKA